MSCFNELKNIVCLIRTFIVYLIIWVFLLENCFSFVLSSSGFWNSLLFFKWLLYSAKMFLPSSCVGGCKSFWDIVGILSVRLLLKFFMWWALFKKKLKLFVEFWLWGCLERFMACWRRVQWGAYPSLLAYYASSIFEVHN